MPEFYYEYTAKAEQLKCEIHEIMNELAVEEMYLDELIRKLNDTKKRLDDLMEVFI